jgi:glycosyltransferase involved in cell wall biosynthesis
MRSVDILVAVRNEENSIPIFVEEINKLAPKNVVASMIFLEDGSTDRTVSVLRELSKKYNNVDYISIDNKYGQYAALSLGLIVSKADAVITMDVDGGHPLETAIDMIQLFLNGDNLVQGHRIIYKRKKVYRSILSQVYNLFYFLFVGINFIKQNVMFRLMDKATKEKFLSNKKWWHIFKTNFSKRDGIKASYINYTAPERELGESKYGFVKLLKLSYKSFFSLLSVTRLIIINIILGGLLLYFASSELVLLSVLCLSTLLVVDTSYYKIINHYPIPLLRIIETSLTDLKK